MTANEPGRKRRRSTLRRGQPVRGSATGRPVMVLLELLGRRQTLRVLWELRAGPLTFRDLQDSCGGASPTVLNKRLAELREAQIVTHEAGAGYALTPSGADLLASLAPLNDWAQRWSTAWRD